jgi:hypothetical protein
MDHPLTGIIERGQGMSGLHACCGPRQKGAKGMAIWRPWMRRSNSTWNVWWSPKKKSHDFRPVLGTRIRYSAKTSRCLRCLVHTISVLVGGWPTPLKNISQLGLLFPIFEKKKHQPGYFCSEQIKKNNENIQGWPKGTAANVFSWWASLCSPWTVGQVRHNIRCFRVYKLV